jgi:hypothetical protein
VSQAVLQKKFSVADDYTVPSVSEPEYSEFLRLQGQTIIQFNGRYWQENPKGFLRPVQYLAQLEDRPKGKPPGRHWGFMAPVPVNLATNCITVHLMENVAGYDFEKLSKKARNLVRKGMKNLEIKEIADPTILKNEGYDIYVSSMRRTARKPISYEEYIVDVDRLVAPGYRLVLGARREGRLVAYMSAHAINGIAQAHDLQINYEGSKYEAARVLMHEMLTAIQRSGDIEKFAIGWYCRELPGLTDYKIRSGFPLTKIPVYIKMNPAVRCLLKFLRPDQHSRLTGKLPGSG